MNKRIKALCLSVLTVGMLAQNVPVNAGDDGGWLGFFFNKWTILTVATVVVACLAPVYKSCRLNSLDGYFNNPANNCEVGSAENESKPRSLCEWLRDYATEKKYTTAAEIASDSDVVNKLKSALDNSEIKYDEKFKVDVPNTNKKTVKVKQLIDFEIDKLSDISETLKSPWLLNNHSFFNFYKGSFASLKQYVATFLGKRALTDLTKEDERKLYDGLQKKAQECTGGLYRILYPSSWLNWFCSTKTEADHYINNYKDYHKLLTLKKRIKNANVGSGNRRNSNARNAETITFDFN